MSVKDMLLLQKSKDMVDSTDEKRLLAELGAGSFQAFEKLYHRYSGKLYQSSFSSGCSCSFDKRARMGSFSSYK